ncbi:hypothetical protein [Paenibacillus glycinis]|uniref:Uncharacterized protein n=1 Tax=Paenibacillus glycinis TaxID=2697035 RepID=A0ABW9Y0T7_9BACL|nr:hypothetical protein [Paenibacillus glycinis]NBD28017.1 hypothetical protein [Paenibacillus glycinis]
MEPLHVSTCVNLLQEIKRLYAGNEKRLNQQIIRKMKIDLRKDNGPTNEVFLNSLFTLGEVGVLT